MIPWDGTPIISNNFSKLVNILYMKNVLMSEMLRLYMQPFSPRGGRLSVSLSMSFSLSVSDGLSLFLFLSLPLAGRIFSTKLRFPVELPAKIPALMIILRYVLTTSESLFQPRCRIWLLVMIHWRKSSTPGTAASKPRSWQLDVLRLRG